VQKQKIIFSSLAILAFSVTFGTVFGQEETPGEEFEMLHAALAMGSFLVAGVFYSSSGWIKKVRRKLVDDTVPLDLKKMGRSVLIGIFLGVGAMVASAYFGDVILVTNAEEFLVQIGLNTSVILLVDKWILGRGTDEKAGPTGDSDDEFIDLFDEIPTEVAPGKSGGP
jgi:hypothetical protein